MADLKFDILVNDKIIGTIDLLDKLIEKDSLIKEYLDSHPEIQPNTARVLVKIVKDCGCD